MISVEGRRGILVRTSETQMGLRVLVVLLGVVGCGGATNTKNTTSPPTAQGALWLLHVGAAARCPAETTVWVMDEHHRPMPVTDYPMQPPPIYADSVGAVDTIKTSTSLCFTAKDGSREQTCVPPTSAAPVPLTVWCQRADGTKHGLYAEWHGAGIVAVVGVYENGVEEGAWRYFDEYGKPTRVIAYVGGEPMGELDPAPPQ